MPLKRRVEKQRRPEISETLLFYISRGQQGDIARCNRFEFLHYRYPYKEDGLAERLEQLETEYYSALDASGQAEWDRTTVQELARLLDESRRRR